MTKRAPGFKRRAQDAYDTPPEAVVPLLQQFIGNGPSFWEPCAGAFMLGDALERGGLTCIGASDIQPRAECVYQRDAMTVLAVPTGTDLIITNPPWTRDILHPMIDHFRSMRPTWLLFDADWMHTKQAIPYLQYCHKIVSIGRISWMQNRQSGFDNCAWYFFGAATTQTKFVGRVA